MSYLISLSWYYRWPNSKSSFFGEGLSWSLRSLKPDKQKIKKPTMEGSVLHNITDNMNLTISDEGSSLPKENLGFKIFKLMCYSFVFLVGVIGNTLVFRMVLRRRKLQTVSNYLICNLAAADIAVLTINLPVRLAYQENSYVWPFGAFLCKIIPMLTYLFITASSATLVLMTFDQHRAVVHPLRRRFTITKTKIAISFIWFFSALITSPLNFSLELVYRKGRPVCTDVWPSDAFERGYFVCLFVIQFLIPLSIIVTAYTNMCKHLDSSGNHVCAESLKTAVQKRTNRNRKVRRQVTESINSSIKTFICLLDLCCSLPVCFL